MIPQNDIIKRRNFIYGRVQHFWVIFFCLAIEIAYCDQILPVPFYLHKTPFHFINWLLRLYVSTKLIWLCGGHSSNVWKSPTFWDAFCFFCIVIDNAKYNIIFPVPISFGYYYHVYLLAKLILLCIEVTSFMEESNILGRFFLHSNRHETRRRKKRN